MKLWDSIEEGALILHSKNCMLAKLFLSSNQNVPTVYCNENKTQELIHDFCNTLLFLIKIKCGNSARGVQNLK